MDIDQISSDINRILRELDDLKRREIDEIIRRLKHIEDKLDSIR